MSNICEHCKERLKYGEGGRDLTGLQMVGKQEDTGQSGPDPSTSYRDYKCTICDKEWRWARDYEIGFKGTYLYEVSKYDDGNHQWYPFPGGPPSDMNYEWCSKCGTLKIIYPSPDPVEYLDTRDFKLNFVREPIGEEKEPECVKREENEDTSPKIIKVRKIDIEETARIMGAEVKGEVDAKGGVFGAMQLAAQINREK